MNNQQVTHGPAQKVGNMRVSRKPFKRKTVKQYNEDSKKEGDSYSDFSSTDEETESDIELSNTTIEIEDLTDEDDEGRMDPLHVRELQDRQARDMQAHVASRQPDISSNAGNNAKHIYNSNPQQRGLNH